MGRTVSIAGVKILYERVEWAITGVKDRIEYDLARGALTLDKVKEYAKWQFYRELCVAAGCYLDEKKYERAWERKWKDIVVPEWYVRWLEAEFSQWR